MELKASDTIGKAWEAVDHCYYLARGCEYDFELYELEPDKQSGALVVNAFGADDSLIWSGSLGVSVSERVIDVVRQARGNAETARADARS